MNQIAAERNRRAVAKKNLLIGYLLGGYPEKNKFLEVIKACEGAGMDVFEIGFPSSNPVSDGEVIQGAHAKVDLSLQQDLSYWRAVRAAIDSPIWVMAYKHDLIDTGFYKKLAEEGLMDGMVVPDISYEQRYALLQELKPLGVDMVGFVSPDMEKDEQNQCFTHFPLVYQQLYAGPTGMVVANSEYKETLERSKSYQGIHVFAGFGINTAERAKELVKDGFDGAIIGTAMITKLNTSQDMLISFVREIKEAMEG